jgi:inner membrane protein
MSRTLIYKLGAIGLLILLLLLAMQMIGGVVDERQSVRNQVLEDIARSSSEAQKITGPLLVVPYRKRVRTWKTHDKTGERYLVESQRQGRLYFLPERLTVDGELRTELRRRGIYEARLYRLDSQLSVDFYLPANYGITEGLEDYRFEQGYLALGISDIRGIQNHLRLQLGKRELPFEPGSNESWLGAGVHAPLPLLDGSTAQRLEFSFQLALQGSSRLHVSPVGRESLVNLKSDWPHPSFIGDYLPTQRSVTDQGFDARWQTSFFATNMQEALESCVSAGDCRDFQQRRFGLSLVDPVDQYLMTERAIKYALLFITLTFAAFFLFEVLKRLAVHPVQYGLVGLALALFYLLLVSLSEHIAFVQAYLIAASACVLLIGFYVSHVLHSWVRGCGFALALAMLYGMLYGLLSAEDYALLMGSCLVFAVLACVMVLTRKLDWYGIGRPVGEA